MKLKKLAGLAMAMVMAGSLAACGGGASTAGGSSSASGGDTQAAQVPESVAGASGSGDAQVILTMAEVNPADSLDGQVLKYFKEQAESLSGGTVLIDIQASGVMGAENDVLDNMTTNGGTIAMARISSFALTNYGAKLSALPSIPYTFNDRDHYWKYADSEIGQRILDEPSELGLGIKGLFFVEEGFRNFFVKDEISGIEGMKDKKIRVSSDPILTAVVEQVGANPTVVSFSELYSSLQSGVVDGADQPIVTYESNAFYEVAPYMLEDGHTMSASEVVITEAVWNQLSDTQKQALEEAGKAASKYCRELSAKTEEECKARLEEKGVTFVEVPDKTAWQEACADVIAQYTEGLEGEYQQILDLK